MTEKKNAERVYFATPSLGRWRVRPWVVVATIFGFIWACNVYVDSGCDTLSWGSSYSSYSSYSTRNDEPLDGWPAGVSHKGKIELETSDFDAAREQIERILADHRAVVHWRAVDGKEGSRRVLHLNASLPGASLAETMIRLRSTARVEDESLMERDTSAKQAELRTEIAVARASEQRLERILASRPGDVPDAMVAQKRLEEMHRIIERKSVLLEAFRRNHSAGYLRVELTQHAPQRPEPTTGQLIARSARDGGEAFVASAVGLTRFLLSVGPAGLFWTVVFFWPVRFLWRTWRAARQAAPSPFDA